MCNWIERMVAQDFNPLPCALVEWYSENVYSMTERQLWDVFENSPWISKRAAALTRLNKVITSFDSVETAESIRDRIQEVCEQFPALWDYAELHSEAVGCLPHLREVERYGDNPWADRGLLQRWFL